MRIFDRTHEVKMKILKEDGNLDKIEKKTPCKVYLEFINHQGEVTGGVLLAQFRSSGFAENFIAEMNKTFKEDIENKSVRIRVENE
jgi:hypothetical protein